jgi:hypothetical protein
MSKLTLRGTSIEEIKSWCATNGQRTVEIKCKAAWSEPVCEEMGWSFDPSGFGNGSLEGSLSAVGMIIEPADKQLEDYRFDLAISKVDKFKHVVETDEGDIVSRHLQFVVTTIADDALAVLDQWLKVCGPAEAKGQCQIRYEAEKQMELGEGGEPAEEEAPEPVVRGRKRGQTGVEVQ